MRRGRPTFRTPLYPEILPSLLKKEKTYSDLAHLLLCSCAYLKQLVYGDRKMPLRFLQKINAYLGLNLEQRKPTPEILPHEQLQIDKESLKDKPLFKD